MKKKVTLLLVLIVLVVSLLPVVQGSRSWEIDMTAVVSRVIDGDTFDTTLGNRVRLADANAPEKGEIGYTLEEPKSLLHMQP